VGKRVGIKEITMDARYTTEEGGSWQYANWDRRFMADIIARKGKAFHNVPKIVCLEIKGIVRIDFTLLNSSIPPYTETDWK
jgi:hypothetical protein